MKWTRDASALLTLFVLSLAPAFALALPNFSGTWQIDKSQSTVQSDRPGAAQVAQQVSVTMVIDHRDPELKIERHGSLGNNERTVVSIYYTDGRESSNRGARGEAITSKSHWENDALVTDLRIVRGQGANAQILTRRDVLSVSRDGKSLVMESTRKEAGHDKPESARLVFLKKK